MYQYSYRTNFSARYTQEVSYENNYGYTLLELQWTRGLWASKCAFERERERECMFGHGAPKTQTFKLSHRFRPQF